MSEQQLKTADWVLKALFGVTILGLLGYYVIFREISLLEFMQAITAILGIDRLSNAAVGWMRARASS